MQKREWGFHKGNAHKKYKQKKRRKSEQIELPPPFWKPRLAKCRLSQRKQRSKVSRQTLCPMDFYCAAVETYLSPLESDFSPLQSCADGRKTINQTLNYINQGLNYINQGLNYINQTLNYINQSLVYRLSLEPWSFSRSRTSIFKSRMSFLPWQCLSLLFRIVGCCCWKQCLWTALRPRGVGRSR